MGCFYATNSLCEAEKDFFVPFRDQQHSVDCSERSYNESPQARAAIQLIALFVQNWNCWANSCFVFNAILTTAFRWKKIVSFFPTIELNASVLFCILVNCRFNWCHIWMFEPKMMAILALFLECKKVTPSECLLLVVAGPCLHVKYRKVTMPASCGSGDLKIQVWLQITIVLAFLHLLRSYLLWESDRIVTNLIGLIVCVQD